MKNSIYSFVLFGMLCISSAYATPILQINGSGQLTGAQNVDVSGVLYDVMFVDDTFTNIFGSTPSFVATSSAEAGVFSQALLDQVFIDSISTGLFDSNPSLTDGCSVNFFNTCFAYTAYASNSSSTILAVGARNEDDGSDGFGGVDQVSQIVQFNNSDNLSSSTWANSVYADWTLIESSVPEPSTLALMGLGLAGLGFSRRRKLQ